MEFSKLSYRKFSIKSKLILIQIMTTFIILLSFLIYYMIDEFNEFKTFSMMQYSSVAQVIGSNCAPALHFLDNEAAEKVMLSLETQKHVVNAWIYNKKKRLFATYNKKSYAEFTYPFYENNVTRKKNNLITIARQIDDEGELIGTLFLRIDESYRWNIVKNNIFIAALLLIIGMIAAFFLSLNTQKSISKPILNLVDIAKEITTSGDFSKRVKTRSGDEIGVLYSGFNKLMGRLQFQEMKRDEVENELKKHKERLEETVEERTIELEKAKDQAESADRLKSAFLASMSHELRTPLNSIIGFTSIILQKLSGPLNPEQEKQLNMVKNSSIHLLNLINDVLDISKIESGRLIVDLAKFDMGKLMKDTIVELKTLAEKKGLYLNVNIDEKVSEIKSDPRRVKQIIINLVNNAIKFTEEGGVTVNCRIENGMILVEVLDTGIGIKKEDIKFLFETFRQLDSGLSREREGTGLGLAICKKLTQLLNGGIKVKSNLESGSTFTVFFPSNDTEILNKQEN
ncbi:MAG: HAMP domain-containing protein [Candidatus Aminicenantes bacterium]|nr:HAMP domain-containing protein [Candidatus Aminicenantes bacterium]